MAVNMDTPAEIFQRHQRQVHLDYHNSPLIADLASEFDAREFARALARARINSVTIFAKCHHGMCYFPATYGTPHPALGGRDLLGEQIEALHREGIRAPIYTTVVWDEDVAARFPAWRQLRRDGTYPGQDNSGHPGAWKYLNYLEEEYQDYLETQVREIAGRYGREIDGFFFDILFFHPEACWSDASRRFRERHGLTADGPGTAERFQSAAQGAFARRFTDLVNRLVPASTTVFYNAPCHLSVDSTAGARTRYPLMTHFEIESLPTGQWGYQHFPKLARAVAHWGQPWVGLTGRFHRSWGDFGGIKPRAALEYECFRTQALGGVNMVGDQLPPRGTLDANALRLIGEVYRQCEAAEPFYAGSRAIPQFANVCAYYPGQDFEAAAHSDEGAMLMAGDMHRDVAMIDERADLGAFELVQLADSVVVTPALAAKLRSYYEAGGSLLLSHRSGFDADGRWALDFLPLSFEGKWGKPVEKFPTYWRTRSEMHDAIGDADRVCYLQGIDVLAGAGTRVLVERVLPYFQRTDATFTSHVHAPPLAMADPSPAVVAGEQFVYFADPIFREYRETGNLMMRDSWHEAMNRLIGPPPYGDGLPKTIQSFPRRRGGDLILTLLHYIPTRKTLELDLIEERSSFAGERLRLPARAMEARIFGGSALERTEDGTFLLPMEKGRLLIEVPGYFLG